MRKLSRSQALTGTLERAFFDGPIRAIQCGASSSRNGFRRVVWCAYRSEVVRRGDGVVTGSAVDVARAIGRRLLHQPRSVLGDARSSSTSCRAAELFFDENGELRERRKAAKSRSFQCARKELRFR